MNFLRTQQLNKGLEIKTIKNKEIYVLINNILYNFKDELDVYINTFKNIINTDIYKKLQTKCNIIIFNIESIRNLNIENIDISEFNSTIELEYLNAIKLLNDNIYNLSVFIEENKIKNNNEIKLNQNIIKNLDQKILNLKAVFKLELDKVESLQAKEYSIYNNEKSRIQVKHLDELMEYKSRLNKYSETYVILTNELLELETKKLNLDKQYKDYNEINKLIRINVLQNVASKNTMIKKNKCKSENYKVKLCDISNLINEIEDYLNDYQLYKLNINKIFYNNIINIKSDLLNIINYYLNLNIEQSLDQSLDQYKDESNTTNNLINIFLSRLNLWLIDNKYNNIFTVLFGKEINNICTIQNLKELLILEENVDNINSTNIKENKCINQLNDETSLITLLNNIEKEYLEPFKGDYLINNYNQLKKERLRNETRLRKLRNRKNMIQNLLNKTNTNNTNINGNFLKRERDNIILLNKNLKTVNETIKIKKKELNELKINIDYVMNKIEKNEYNDELTLQNTRCEKRLNTMKSRYSLQIENLNNNFKNDLEELTLEKASKLEQIKELQQNEKYFNITFKSRLTSIIENINNNILF